jgi:hypothetical protein
MDEIKVKKLATIIKNKDNGLEIGRKKKTRPMNKRRVE